MLIYVAGPYSGNIERNIAQAREIAAKLWLKGHAVICPHMNSAHLDEGTGITWDQFMAGDLTIISVCDAVVMTPDWQESRGAKIEHEYAATLKIPIFYAPNLPELHVTEVRSPIQAKAFREFIGRMYRVHLKKNADYSPANILGAGKIGVVTRIWDKVARLMSLSGFVLHLSGPSEYVGPREAENESLIDTLVDLAVYSVIGWLLEHDLWGK